MPDHAAQPLMLPPTDQPGSGTRARYPARLGHWPASSARSLAGKSSSFSRAELISGDDTAGTAFREDHLDSTLT